VLRKEEREIVPEEAKVFFRSLISNEFFSLECYTIQKDKETTKTSYSLHDKGKKMNNIHKYSVIFQLIIVIQVEYFS
jgi:hypothetical protein